MITDTFDRQIQSAVGVSESAVFQTVQARGTNLIVVLLLRLATFAAFRTKIGRSGFPAIAVEYRCIESPPDTQIRNW